MTAGTTVLADAIDVEALYRAHAPFLGRVVIRLVGDGPHVDDILQDTFLTAHRRRGSYDPERGAPRAWLMGIALNVARRRKSGVLRRLRAYTRLASEPAVERLSLDDELARAQQARFVRLLIAELPRKQREVFVLFELEELEGREIAEILDVPLGTVWTRLHHARRRFRRRVEAAQKRSETP